MILFLKSTKCCSINYSTKLNCTTIWLCFLFCAAHLFLCLHLRFPCGCSIATILKVQKCDIFLVSCTELAVIIIPRNWLNGTNFHFWKQVINTIKMLWNNFTNIIALYGSKMFNKPVRETSSFNDAELTPLQETC